MTPEQRLLEPSVVINERMGRGVTTPRLFQWVLSASLLAACSSECVFYPCPLPEAAVISVAGSNGKAGIPGLAVSISSPVITTIACEQESDGTDICRVPGPFGVYQATLSAPGYQTARITFTVTGVAAGCNTCGRVDRQLLSVVLKPATAS